MSPLDVLLAVPAAVLSHEEAARHYEVDLYRELVPFVGLGSHEPRVAIHRSRLNVLTAFPKNGPDATLETPVQGAQLDHGIQ